MSQARVSTRDIRRTSWRHEKPQARLAKTKLSSDKATSSSNPLSGELRAIIFVIAIALAGLGISSGAGGATWPDVLDAFDISSGWFGLLNGLGIVVSLPLLIYGGRVISRTGKIPLLIASAVGFVIVAAGFVFAPRAFFVFAILMLIRGMSYATLDLSANALAMDAERVAKKHLMSPLHAGYSAGAVVGAAMSALLFSQGSSYRVVYLIVAVIFIGIALAPALVAFRDRLADPNANTQDETVSFTGFRDATIRLAAIMAGLSFGGEVLIAEWVAIYLRDERGFASSTGALAVTSYGVALMVGRLVNGPFVNRLGLKPSFQLQGILTVIGGVMIVAGGPPIVALTGAFIAGFGLAGVGPSGLSLAGKAMPTAPGAAAGLTLLGGYIGLGVAPLLGGLFASIASTRMTLACVALAGAGILIASLAVREDT
ncbi:MAG: MFS transporter [Thermomicrobiales bacterium]|nr:MFS transporter [Thermomicrobiales bacterium]MCO5221303.1 MFS transporter [Thermomicrobiales bacterium]